MRESTESLNGMVCEERRVAQHMLSGGDRGRDAQSALSVIERLWKQPSSEREQWVGRRADYEAQAHQTHDV